MSTFLELVQKVADESGTLNVVPSSVVGQTGRHADVVRWTKDAWVLIQNLHNSWRFMRGEFPATALTTGGTARYTAASWAITRFAEWLDEPHLITIYDNALGVSDEGEIEPIEWWRWRTMYARGVQDQNKPVHYSISPANEFALGPVPNGTYRLNGEYRKSPQVLAANGDIPDMPERFHDIIVWRAMMLLGEFDEGAFPITTASRKYEELLAGLRRDQLPQVHVGAGTDCLMSQQTKYFATVGGLDLVTPSIRVAPGFAIGANNYAPVPRGYQRIDGFERFDGLPKPSEAAYWVLNFDAGVATIASGATVTGETSSATGVALMAMVVETGTFGGSDAAGYLVLTNVSGTFQDNENLQVSAATKAVANGVATQAGADNDTDDSTWQQDAIETARTAIQAVPGSGRIRGVWKYNGNVYAFRDNIGGLAGVMHKSTTGGWVAQDLGRSIAFTSGGTVEVEAGDTITGATSGATAVVRRVQRTSGTFAGGDAAGRLILSGQVGTFQTENLNIGASLNVASIGGDTTVITLPAGGRYEFLNHNFYGAANLRRMYGVNGVGTAFEYDGTAFVPIITGMAVDAPNHISEHKDHLFLSFPGGSVQHSPIGDPTDVWSVVLGAGELGMGDEVTGFMDSGTGALTILARNLIAVLYGNNSSDWDLVKLNDSAGAQEWTAQNIGQPTYLDKIGLRHLTATQAYGNFKTGSITQAIEPLLANKRKLGVTPIASVRVRSKDQYRLFFSDNSGLIVYVGRKNAESLPFDLGMVVRCISASEDDGDEDEIYFGSDDGYVYQMDAGTSFDGDAVEAYIRLAFNHIGSPTQNKRWHKATLEIDAGRGVEIGMIAEFAYADADQPPSEKQGISIAGGGNFWDVGNWDEFFWSAPVQGLAELHMDGIGQNVSIAVVSEAIYEMPHIITGITLHYTLRGLKR